MPEDTSLDQFLDGSTDRADSVDHEEADDDATTGEPAVSTYRFDPGGGTCASCGETVTARWRDADGTEAEATADAGAAFVCSSCKSW